MTITDGTDRHRGLSLFAADRCENARIKRCDCRCAGTRHGAARTGPLAWRRDFEDLPEGDPHHLTPNHARRHQEELEGEWAAAALAMALRLVCEPGFREATTFGMSRAERSFAITQGVPA